MGHFLLGAVDRECACHSSVFCLLFGSHCQIQGQKVCMEPHVGPYLHVPSQLIERARGCPYFPIRKTCPHNWPLLWVYTSPKFLTSSVLLLMTEEDEDLSVCLLIRYI